MRQSDLRMGLSYLRVVIISKEIPEVAFEVLYCNGSILNLRYYFLGYLTTF